MSSNFSDIIGAPSKDVSESNFKRGYENEKDDSDLRGGVRDFFERVRAAELQ